MRAWPTTDVLDVPALTTLLDGRYREVRDLVRANLVEHASILDEAETLSRDEFRERVLDVVRLMAGTGQTGFGFPEEYGGGGDIGASVAAFETLAFGDLSVLVKLGVQFGLFGGAILQLGTEPHHDAYLDDLIHGRLLGCFAMTETGHGSNVQALGTTATYDPETERVRHRHPGRPRAQGLHRQRRPARPAIAVVFAQLVVGGESHGVHAFVVPLRDEQGAAVPGVRIEDCGPKIGLNGVDNGRIWFAGVRVPRTDLLDRYAERHRRRALRLRHREPRPPLLHHARHPRAGPGLRRRRGDQRHQGRAGDRGRVRPPPPAVRHPGLAATEKVLLDYGMHQRRLLPLLARTYALHFAQERVAADLHARVLRHADDGAAELARRALESRAAGTKALGTWHASPHHPGVPRGVRRRRATSRSTASTRCAPTPTSSPPSRATTPILMQLVAKGLLTDYGLLRGPRPDRHWCGSSPSLGRRDGRSSGPNAPARS